MKILLRFALLIVFIFLLKQLPDNVDEFSLIHIFYCVILLAIIITQILVIRKIFKENKLKQKV